MKTSYTLSLAALALAFAACSSGTSSSTSTTPAPAAAAASSGSTAGDTIVATEILVNVINNNIPPAAITVWALGPSIGRLILGNVSQGETKAFTFKAGNLNGNYQLIAQAQGSGTEKRSQTFNLTPTLRFVQWTLDVNSLVQYATPK